MAIQLSDEIFRFYFFRLKLRLILKWKNRRTDCPYIPPQRYVEFPWTAEAFKKICAQKPSASLLELGCGSGFFLSCLSRYTNGRVTGIDMDITLKEAGQFARALNTHTRFFTFFSDASRLPFHDNVFDAVVSVSAIEHFSENKDSLAMTEIYRVLKKEGIAIITLPVTDVYEETYKEDDVYSTKFKGKPVFFERWYDQKALQERILAPAPFTVKLIEFFVNSLEKQTVISSLAKISPLPGMESVSQALQWNQISSPVKHRFGNGPVVCLVLQK